MLRLEHIVAVFGCTKCGAKAQVVEDAVFEESGEIVVPIACDGCLDMHDARLPIKF